MGCERMEELLSPYLEDELTEEERQTIQIHIRTCASCAELLSLMRETKKSLSFFPEVDVSESLTEKLYELPQKRKKFRLSVCILQKKEMMGGCIDIEALVVSLVVNRFLVMLKISKRL